MKTTPAGIPDSHSSYARRRLSQILRVFRQRHMRLTPVRLRAMQVLSAAATPITVQQLHERLLRYRRINPATTYRLVHDLVDIGVVKGLPVTGRTATGYVVHLPGETNDFVACLGCGALIWLEDLAELRALERRLAKELHFGSLTHELTLRGRCEPCQKQG